MRKKSKIAVPIFLNKDFGKLREKIREAKKKGGEAIELRGDSFSEIREEDLEKLREICQKEKILAIFTLRDKEEGGKLSFPFERKLRLIKKALSLNFEFLDLEWKFLERLKTDWKRLKGKSRTKLILSYHNFKKRYTLPELKRIKNKISSFHPDIVKIAIFSFGERENKAVLELIKREKNIIGIAMGEKGKKARLEGIFYNFFSYFSLNEKSAPGQLSLEDLKTWQKILALRKKLDKISERLIRLLAKRRELIINLKAMKKELNLEIEDREREKEVLEGVKELAKRENLDPVMIKKIFKILIENAKKIQKD